MNNRVRGTNSIGSITTESTATPYHIRDIIEELSNNRTRDDQILDHIQSIRQLVSSSSSSTAAADVRRSSFLGHGMSSNVTTTQGGIPSTAAFGIAPPRVDPLLAMHRQMEAAAEAAAMVAKLKAAEAAAMVANMNAAMTSSASHSMLDPLALFGVNNHIAAAAVARLNDMRSSIHHGQGNNNYPQTPSNPFGIPSSIFSRASPHSRDQFGFDSEELGAAARAAASLSTHNITNLRRVSNDSSVDPFDRSRKLEAAAVVEDLILRVNARQNDIPPTIPSYSTSSLTTRRRGPVTIRGRKSCNEQIRLRDNEEDEDNHINRSNTSSMKRPHSYDRQKKDVDSDNKEEECDHSRSDSHIHLNKRVAFHGPQNDSDDDDHDDHHEDDEDEDCHIESNKQCSMNRSDHSRDDSHIHKKEQVAFHGLKNDSDGYDYEDCHGEGNNQCTGDSNIHMNNQDVFDGPQNDSDDDDEEDCQSESNNQCSMNEDDHRSAAFHDQQHDSDDDDNENSGNNSLDHNSCTFEDKQNDLDGDVHDEDEDCQSESNDQCSMIKEITFNRRNFEEEEDENNNDDHSNCNSSISASDNNNDDTGDEEKSLVDQMVQDEWVDNKRQSSPSQFETNTIGFQAGMDPDGVATETIAANTSSMADIPHDVTDVVTARRKGTSEEQSGVLYAPNKAPYMKRGEKTGTILNELETCLQCETRYKFRERVNSPKALMMINVDDLKPDDVGSCACPRQGSYYYHRKYFVCLSNPWSKYVWEEKDKNRKRPRTEEEKAATKEKEYMNKNTQELQQLHHQQHQSEGEYEERPKRRCTAYGMSNSTTADQYQGDSGCSRDQADSSSSSSKENTQKKANKAPKCGEIEKKSGLDGSSKGSSDEEADSKETIRRKRFARGSLRKKMRRQGYSHEEIERMVVEKGLSAAREYRYVGKEKGSVEDEKRQKDGKKNWVQCEKCDKWRILPSHVNIASLPKHWYCENNIYDPNRNSCDHPEDREDPAERTITRKPTSIPKLKHRLFTFP